MQHREKEQNLTSQRVADFFHILKLKYLTIKMNYFASNFSWKKMQAHTFEKEQIFHSIWIVDPVFVLGDRFEIFFFLLKVIAVE